MTRARAAAFALTLAACGLDGAPPSLPPLPGTPPTTTTQARTLIELTLDEPAAERPASGVFDPPRRTLTELLETLDDVRTKEARVGLFLRIGEQGGAWARAEEVVRSLRAIRETGKPVHCHFAALDNVGYRIAAEGCDRISMTPAGTLNLVGAAAQVFYARTLLESVGVRAELEQVGRFKGAADTFTRDSMPEETRESLGGLIDALDGQLVQAVSRGRGVDVAVARRAVDGGPYDDAEALAARLVDAVAFDDEARADAKRASRADDVRDLDARTRVQGISLAKLLEALGAGPAMGTAMGPRVALVHMTGTIDDSEQERVDGIASTPYVRALRRLADDASVRAVVLRIDSPGGSALASDRIWHAARRVAKRKPLVVSIGDMAASGGYYIASASSAIFASPTSIVGSIGVVGGKIDASELTARLGIRVEALARSPRATWASPLRPLSPDERADVRASLEATYRRFLSRIREGRAATSARLEQAAEGRLHSGDRAREFGLVDQLGGLRDALAHARTLGGLGPTAPIETWPPRRTWIDALAEGLVGPTTRTSATAQLGALVVELGGDRDTFETSFDFLRVLGRERVVAMPGFALDVR